MTSKPPHLSNQTLIDELLAEQGSLTAVERFSQRHAHAEFPLQQQYYRDLLPLTQPKVGQQYAFEVDLDKCSGCKACVTACHSLNGLEENETWRSVGLLVGHSRGSEQRTVTTACHHCVDPACLNGCPVLAYDKHPVTGIVSHLDDQCIGCQYCVLKCPYEVPQYSKSLGIVRKCDMCSSRLAVNEAPACVQACPNAAIAIRIVEHSDVVGSYRGDDGATTAFLPTAPNPAYTLPTTKYITKNAAVSSLEAADYNEVRLQPAHLPLMVMLVLMQTATGIYCIHAWLQPSLSSRESFQFLFLGAICTILGSVASVFHLGRPKGAWRIFLGWRRSWLSREAIVFGVLVKTALMATLLLRRWPEWERLHSGFAWVLVLLSTLGTLASVMVYHDTRRSAWNWKVTGFKFLGTTILLGLASVLALGSWTGALTTALVQPLTTVLFLGSLAKLAWEIRLLRSWTNSSIQSLRKSAILSLESVPIITRIRYLLLGVGGIFFTFILLVQPQNSKIALALLVTLLSAEMVERYLFFTTVAADKMPGGFR